MKTLPQCSAVALAFTFFASTANAAEPIYASLPVGQLSTPPAKAPAHVRRREKFPGLSVTRGQLHGSGDMLEIQNACVVHGAASTGEWPDALEVSTVIDQSVPPTAIHTEELRVASDGSATLESVDGWVNPKTRGATVTAKTSLPLKLVRKLAFGVNVYAGRDERPDGRRFVQFVLARPGGDGFSAETLEGTVLGSSGCKHRRIAIAVGRGAVDEAVVLSTGIEVRKEESDPPEQHAITPEEHEPDEPPLETKTMRIQISVSQTSSEKDPMVSVSASWAPQ